MPLYFESLHAAFVEPSELAQNASARAPSVWSAPSLFESAYRNSGRNGWSVRLIAGIPNCENGT